MRFEPIFPAGPSASRAPAPQAPHAHRELLLLPERAAWEPRTRTLWIADVHLGKAATFRALGQPAPGGTTLENLARLAALVEAWGAARVVFLGDLFHARQAYAPAQLGAFLAWRRRHLALEIVLVRGNHDARAGDPPASAGIEMADEPYTSGGVEGRHFPLDDAAALRAPGPTVLAGHIHPAVRLRGPGRDCLRFPCFVLEGRQVVLPAFGEFTGAALVAPSPAAEICAITAAGLVLLGGRAPLRGDRRHG
jgi:DNA ligase-associated metallophosphoesterase